ncbi:uncharacterized protein [Clytia hemisphaerica]|uniref:Right handed beta helix domain-containing protein n=1 Tax=Clytia hemisphaerica TaxID=252671 RepID=A0A7M5XBQ2_9CNID
MTAVPLVAMVTDPKDGGHWDITVLRTEFSCVGLFMKLNNGSFQLIDSSVTGTVMNQNFFIQLSNFDRFYAKNMTCGDDVCSSGNWGYMKIDHISKVTIVNTSEPFIYNINSNVIQVTNVDYLNVSNNNFSRLYSYSGVLVFSDIQNLIFNRNTITSMTKFTYNNGAFLWLKRINHTLMDFTTFDNVQAPTIKCTDCNAFNMYKTNFTSSYCPINIVGFQNINVDSCHFFNNTAGRGAGMSVNGDGKLVLKNCNFTENKALFMESYYNSGFQAGAIDSVDANIDISNSVFLYNNAETSGTFRITGDHFKTVRLSNVNITTPDKDIPKFATAFEINGPNLITKGLKVVIQASKGDIDIFTTHFNKSLSELMFQCPKNAQVNNAEEIFFSCKHCQKDKYTEQAGSLHYHMHNNTMPYRISESFKCHACPYGGQCTGMEQLSSRPNFWGFVQNEIVKFIQCKSGYCCGVGDKCAGIDSCANGRTGPICGQCHENHYVNFFDSKCIPNEECTHQILTWVIFSVAAVLVFLVVAYFQDPWSLFPCCKLYICKTCKNIDSDTHEGAERESLLTPLLDNDDSHQIADKSYEGTSDARNNKVNKKHERDHHSSNKPKQTTVIFGFIKILFNFYQIKLLITIEKPSRHLHQKYEWIRQILPTVFNLRVTIEDFSTSFCFLLGMDDIWKLFIRYVLLFLVLIVLAVLAILAYHGFNFLFYREKKTRTPEVDLPPDDTFTFDIRCKIFLARIVFIGYTNIVTFLMAMTSWAHVKDDELVLLVKGDTGYFNAWTITCMVFLVLWAAPFPFNVYFTTRWLQNKDITINKFIICFLFPPLSLLLCKQADDETQIDEPKAPYLLSMYEAPFRAKESKEDKRILLWDGVIAFRRFLIAGVCVCT